MLEGTICANRATLGPGDFAGFRNPDQLQREFLAHPEFSREFVEFFGC